MYHVFIMIYHFLYTSYPRIVWWCHAMIYSYHFVESSSNRSVFAAVKMYKFKNNIIQFVPSFLAICWFSKLTLVVFGYCMFLQFNSQKTQKGFLLKAETKGYHRTVFNMNKQAMEPGISRGCTTGRTGACSASPAVHWWFGAILGSRLRPTTVRESLTRLDGLHGWRLFWWRRQCHCLVSWYKGQPRCEVFCVGGLSTTWQHPCWRDLYAAVIRLSHWLCRSFAQQSRTPLGDV